MKINISYKHVTGIPHPIVSDKEIPEGCVVSYSKYPEYVIIRNGIHIAYISSDNTVNYTTSNSLGNSQQFPKGTVITFKQNTTPIMWI